MTFPRLPGSADERDAEAVVAILCRELLTPMDDDVVAGQLEAMLLEFDWEQEAEPSSCRPRLRTPAVIGSCLVAVALSLTSGLGAAGALPATAQHWLSRASRIIGIPLPDAPRSGSTPAPPGTDPSRVAPAPTGANDRVERSSAVVKPRIAAPQLHRSTPSTPVPQPTRAGAHPSPKSASPPSKVAEEAAPEKEGDDSADSGATAPNGGNGNGANAGAGKSAAAQVVHGPKNGGRAAAKKNADPTEPKSEIDTVKKPAVKKNGVQSNL
jgi:hypothetical protein